MFRMEGAAASPRAQPPLITLEHRFVQGPDGGVFTRNQFAYDFWEPYVEAWGHVRVAARISVVEQVPQDWRRADGDRLSFVALPYYQGPVGFLRRLPRLVATFVVATRGCEVALLRAPGPMSVLLYLVARCRRLSFGVEVVGDGEAVFVDGGVGGRLASFYAAVFTKTQRLICRQATATAYVTGTTLQAKYPNSRGREYSVPDVRLVPDAFSTAPRTSFDRERLDAVLVGSLEQPYKGVDVALHALARARESRDVRLVILGDGALRPAYEHLARDLGIADAVVFKGAVAHSAVRQQLDRSDVFLMPSRTEGMPRALLEAMARGLPALASSVGGIPEVLDPPFLLRPGDAEQLADRLVSLTPAELDEMAQTNWDRAAPFDQSSTSAAHRRFLEDLLTMCDRRAA